MREELRKSRTLKGEQRKEVRSRVIDAKRYTFIESGVTHPNFAELSRSVTTAARQAQVQKALKGVLQPAAA